MMKQILAIIAILVLAHFFQQEDAYDIEDINQTASNYMESWYKGNDKVMKQSIHNKLAKRSFKPGFGEKKDLRLISASDMVKYTKEGYGKRLWTKDMDIEVVILDFYKNIDSVKVLTKHYYEYLHLAKTGEKWVIVNALYESNKSK